MLLLAITLLLSEAVFAQSYTKCRWVVIGSPVVLDSLSVLPSSIQVNSDSSDFSYDLNTGTITIRNSANDSVEVSYQTLPISFHHTTFNRSLQQYDSNAFFKDKPILNKQEQELFRTENIEKSGAIVRGFAAGNNQDMVVNSTMDVELEGELAENLRIKAKITDQNVPYQPEGTTQYVQDIDNIFIQLYNDNLSLTAGDITIKQHQEGFLRYNKRVQGGQFENKFPIGNKTEAVFSIATSVAKGKFASENIEVQEGIAGPYKIKPPNGERYVFIVANTEKVYLDGNLLERGFEHDYVIDYNQSEITFTNRVIVTRYSRIKIDFEYADKNYNRSIIAANHAQTSGKHSFYFNYYQEKDNKNNPLSATLSESDKLLLYQAGDSNAMLVTSSYDSIGYHNNEILYKKIIVDGNEIFQFSNHPDSAAFRVKFMEVGEGKGNYIKHKLVGNGWVYRWIMPINSVPQGNYEPMVQEVPPNKKSMATTGGSYQINQHETIFAELALSNNDKNLFSPNDDSDNEGFAYKFGIKSKERQIGSYKLLSQLNFESLGKSFTSIDRYKSIEYERYWETGKEVILPGDDNLLEFSTSLENEEGDYFRYVGAKRKFYRTHSGDQHNLSMAKNIGKLQFDGDYFVSSTKNSLYGSNWNRLNSEVKYLTSAIVPGYAYRFEKNKVESIENDSVVGTAGYFMEHLIYVRNNDSLKTSYGLNYSFRNDFAPINGNVNKQQQSETWSFELKSPSNLSHVVNSNLSYRKIDPNTEFSGFEKGENISGSLYYGGKLWDNLLTPELSYGISNGRELKREYIFVQVPTGEGHFTWIDDNNDGVQDLSEFYEARFDDEMNFAKIFVPTEDYIVAFSNDLNVRLKFDPSDHWTNSKGLTKAFSRFSCLSSFIYSKKIVNNNIWQRLSPFIDDLNNTLSYRNSRRLQIFYNRTHPVYGLGYDYQQLKRRQILTNGFEESSRTNSRFILRINLLENTIFRINAGKGWSSSGSDYLLNRNYEIDQKELEPEIEWLVGRNYRFTGKFHLISKNSQEAEQHGKANFKSIDFGISGNSTNGRMIGFNFAFTNIDYKKPDNSFLEYEMLEALRAGNNITWRFRMQQDLINGLQISVHYDGRKSESNNAIHFGRVQLMAYF